MNDYFEVKRDSAVANSLGSAFSLVSDKKQAWDNMMTLTSDNNQKVRASAYHSLGEASIFKASNDADFKKEEKLDKIEIRLDYIKNKRSRKHIFICNQNRLIFSNLAIN